MKINRTNGKHSKENNINDVECIIEKQENHKTIEKKEKNNILDFLKQYLWNTPLLAVIFILLYLSMSHFNDAKEIYTLNNYKVIILIISAWVSGYLILKSITNKTKLSLAIVCGIEACFDIINCIVRIVRGSAITISDITAIRTALSVSSKINTELDKNFAFGVMYIAIIISIISIFRNKFVSKKDNKIARAIKFIIGVILLFNFLHINSIRNYSLWDVNNAYRVIGTPATIHRMIKDINIKSPIGYNKDEIKNLLKKYDKDLKEINDKDKPNILVIINESFCDYHNLYKEGYSDPIEFITKLSKGENVISGTMYSSEYGGQTSNVEYEFLTQNSTKVLPEGSYVFQQYIPRNIKSSIVTNLKDQGYKTIGVHPWEPFAYSRNKIYKFFGFDSIKFRYDIPELEISFNNGYFSDRSTYRGFMNQIKQKDKNEKIFGYLLTVQNHIAYEKEDPNQVIYHHEKDKNVYMQLLHESSEGLKDEIIEQLKNTDEKYILLFFGDHQPNLDVRNNS